jgi:hypothetical protein
VTPDHSTIAQEHVDKADEWANRDSVINAEHRAHMVDYHLRLAQIHATLSVAQEVSRIPVSAM